MEAREFLETIRGHRFFREQIVHVEELPERPARFAELQGGVAEPVRRALAKQGVQGLYSHQAEAIQHIRAGRNVVVVTGTASGKTLCYNIPVVEGLLDNPRSTNLYVFPTKALAQDQLRGLAAFQSPGDGFEFLAGAYDGDTPQNLRRKLRDGSSVILTNPDMLHQAILPHHARWNRFFTNLRYVVIDEIHAYRGIFGSHLANVLRRLRRLCRHYGSSPRFICCSATIANPREHAQAVTGVDMELVDQDGSPRGPKRFVFWNPPPLETAARGRADDWRVGGDRRSPIGEAVQIMAALVESGVQTIAFVRTRLAAELLYKNVRDVLRNVSPRLSRAVHAYRGGYLPEERREIERRLVSREILGVSSTNALELGIDIGSLDACLLVGYPGSIASLWQQSGRAGRGHEEAVVFFIGQNSPMDQYLMLHCDYVFGRSPEQAVVDPDNPHVAIGHTKCAVHELPLGQSDAEPLFGPYAPMLLDLLEEQGMVRRIADPGARRADQCHWYWSCSDYPASDVNLRNIAGPVYTIQDEARGERVIGTMDEVTALSQLHSHAVYLHGADTYFVNELDLDQKIAHVERRELDYYTQSVQTSQIRIDEIEEDGDWRGGGVAGFGDVTVTTSIPMFKKIRFHSRDSLGFEKLELPPQLLETVAMWMAPPEDVVHEMTDRGIIVGEALIGIANVFVEVAPLFVMCDPQDIGTVVDASCLKRDTLFLHDRYPGGVGYARRCLDRLDDIIATIADVVRDCACEDGCPSCVGSAVPPFAMSDLDSAVRGRIPDKAGARFLLDALAERG